MTVLLLVNWRSPAQIAATCDLTFNRNSERGGESVSSNAGAHAVDRQAECGAVLPQLEMGKAFARGVLIKAGKANTRSLNFAEPPN